MKLEFVTVPRLNVCDQKQCNKYVLQSEIFGKWIRCEFWDFSKRKKCNDKLSFVVESNIFVYHLVAQRMCMQILNEP